jgi:hypothetical protein
MSQGGDIDYSTMLRIFSLMALHAVQGIMFTLLHRGQNYLILHIQVHGV